MNQLLQKILAGILVLGFVASTCVFTVSENELAERSRFQEIIQSGYTPGLHFKLPFEKVRK